MRQFLKKIAILLGVYSIFDDFRSNRIRQKKLAEAGEEIKFYSTLFSKGDLCFDIGGNLGYKADVFLAAGAKVICVEPQPDCVKILNKHFKNNANITIVPKGLADKEGKLELSICEQAPTITTMSEKWQRDGRFADDYNWNKKIIVEVETLDQLIKKYGVPQFCKIDVEGFEESVIKGLSKPIPFLSFEFTSEFFSDAKKIITYLSALSHLEVNFVLYDYTYFHLPVFVSPEKLYQEIESLTDKKLNGDIYVKSLQI